MDLYKLPRLPGVVPRGAGSSGRLMVHRPRGQKPAEPHKKPERIRAPSLAATLLFTAGAYGQPAGHGFHPPMPDQTMYFHVAFEERTNPIGVEEALALPSPSLPAVLDQLIALPFPYEPIRLVRYLPLARLEQTVEELEAHEGSPAIRLVIEGPSQAYERWLVADDPERNRLVSFAGTWRFLRTVDPRERDELYVQFAEEFTRTPTITLEGPNGGSRRVINVEPGARTTLEELGCSVLVECFFADFAVDPKTNEPTDRTDRRLNPAALIKIECKGTTEERWVFARFPHFSRKGSIRFQSRQR